ncbi:ABC transporter substrate-binding protein [Dactylosporangium matsuzakiense]|uniref:Peptide ABC transporter substrate-binding protein n=1 Tax=Dactylosporangium matsuzakiense TaxID=53360 RepID=A0A9W6KDY5_9ACTN|nr:ABC transporter substrate-binding protein [Dactylosporangium matsuzakiense]UWZ47267.1 ABC transporter substrate-binding protein [Dactylosporangium matsuzakiense]GLK98279.1 peptide ABC transporter substrate-binding protein [Dactylosporangium matsuzakiense]
MAGAVTAALALSACGGGSSSDNSSKDKGPKGTAGYNAAVTGVVNPSDKPGGTLKLTIHDDPDSLDPQIAYYASEWNLMKSFYVRTLLANDTKPGADGLKLVPDLATEVPTPTDGGKTYTFKLKPGVKFEDGTPITSKDVKYGIERIFAREVITAGPSYLVDLLDQGQKYPGVYKDTDPDKMGLRSVQTPDDSTIVFTLAKPFADFLYMLQMPVSAPLPKAKDTGSRYAQHPVSSGPYKFESYDEGKKLSLVRNDQWDPKTDPVRKALPDRVEVVYGTAVEEIDNQLLANEVDIDIAQTGVQPGTQPKILLNPETKKYADSPVTGFIRYVAISTKVPPFDNIHCRKAVQYALDKTAMQTARGGVEAGGDIATNMLPPTIAGHDDADDVFNTKSGKPQIDKAKEELAACGKPNGFDTVLATRNTGKELKTAEAVQQSMAAVGINARLDPQDAALYFRSIIGSPGNVHSKGYGLMMAGWGADYPTPAGFLQVLVDSRLIYDSGNNNYSELQDPAIDALIDQATAEPDPQKNAGIWKQINAKVSESAAYMPFTYDKALNYRNPRLTNVYINQYYGQVDFGSLGVTS